MFVATYDLPDVCLCYCHLIVPDVSLLPPMIIPNVCIYCHLIVLGVCIYCHLIVHDV